MNVGAILLYVMSCLAPLADTSFFELAGALIASICAARVAVRIIAPIASIIFKWIVIGKYKSGTYKLYVPVSPNPTLTDLFPQLVLLLPPMVDCQPESPDRWSRCLRDTSLARKVVLSYAWRAHWQERNDLEERQIG